MARHPARNQPPEKPESSSAWGQPQIAGGLALAAVALMIYWPSLQAGWLNDWDDDYNVTGNASLRSLAGLWHIWIPTSTSDWHDWPLTSTFLWIEWHLFGDQTLGYRLCSLGLHVLNGFLIWRLLRRLGLRWGWLGGFLFVLHPLAVESVAWISEIKNTLSLFLFLLSFDAWLDFDSAGKKSSWFLSLA